MARLIEEEYPTGGFRTEFNLCMRAVRAGWLPDDKAQSLLDEAMTMAKANQLPLRQLRQMLTAYAKHKGNLLKQLGSQLAEEQVLDDDLRQLLTEFIG